MAVDYKFKDNYTIDDLVDIIKILRAPGGCPWDIEQTHESIRKDFIEETYEVIEAINKKDTELLKEELGDVMLQVAFHTQIENEKGNFTFDDVADGICKKMIIRHPHVFGDIKVDGTDDVLTNWDAIKRRTKHQKSTSETMESVPRELPALMRCNKLQGKAAKDGIDLKDNEEVSAYIKNKTEKASESFTKESVGELLFAVVAAARKNGIDPEEALTIASDKFVSDFTSQEKGNQGEGLYK